ncbi:glycosyltransferase family 4 protein [Kluyvera sichuanensis]|uniref:glycosyltransferase family 4 protein n=1 Tax=Kluyvera sichuanensis TaxID=2725494 RepID=UPI003F670EA4
MKKITFIINNVDFLLSHRLQVVLGAQSEGFQVHVIAPNASHNAELERYNIIGHNVILSRGGNNPFFDLATLFQLVKLLKLIKPDLVHLVTIKPTLYGGIASRIAKVPCVVAAVSGLGTVFMSKGIMSNIRRKIVTMLYCSALKHKRIKVIFQNPDDQQLFIDSGVTDVTNSCLIRGSGVDLEKFPFYPEKISGNTVVMASRLLKDKGIYEYIEAARLLKKREVNVAMKIIGSTDPCNPTSVTEGELKRWESEGIIEVCGFRRDIAEQYANANVVCLPSYREGLPKCLVEAAACGRAVVTTDVPGCRDAIEAQITGLLVSVRDAESLADAIEFLLNNPEKRIQMGKSGRLLAENEFSIGYIVDQHLSIYRELMQH